MDKVTLIIPVYNSEKYIGRCLDSILNQKYKNFEIMIINDGSTDKSQEIINEYKQKWPNKIITIEQENKGVAITRNEAIKQAKSEYIMFIDNDDYIDKDYIEVYIKTIKNGDYDVVLGGYRRPNEHGKIVKKLKLKEEEWCKYMIMTPWAKIYKRQFLIDNHIEFLNNNIGEDIFFNINLILKSKKIKIIDYIGYNWFFNTQSVSNTSQKNIKHLQVYNLLDSCYNMVKDNDWLNDNYEILEVHFTRYIIWLLSFSTKGLNYTEISNEYNKLFNWLRKRFPDYKKNKMISYTKPKGEIFIIRFLVKSFLIAHNMHLGKILIYLYNKI